MEIHPPRPVHSLKEFLRELLTVTAGILIALSLEGMLEWHHHRELVKEARANIITEVRANAHELDVTTVAVDQSSKQLDDIMKVILALERHEKVTVKQLPFSDTLAELHDTSWNTANSTGALSYMPYEEVKRYTEIYDLQRAYMQAQQKELDAVVGVESLGTLMQKGFSHLTANEISGAERSVAFARASMGTVSDFGGDLQQRYDKLLKQQH
jgi:hypothetical protein